jgi:hypothetical protein
VCPIDNSPPLDAQAFARDLLVSERTRARSVLMVGSLLYPGFLLLDLVMYPEQLVLFGTIRVACTTALFGMLLYLPRVKSLAGVHHSIGVVYLMCSGGVAAMCWATEGATSPYYAGICLAMVLVSVFFTWRMSLSALLHSAVVVIYLTAVNLHGFDGANSAVLVNNLLNRTASR